MASASAPASEPVLAVQPTAPGGSVAIVPPPTASATEAADLSAGTTIGDDPGPATATAAAAAV